ncbi:MAG: hypothetical protein R3C14_30220 [Caldilineaceae bacterium]
MRIPFVDSRHVFSVNDYLRSGRLWAVSLVAIGLLFLAWNFGLFAPYEPWPQYILALIFMVVGVSFFFLFVRARQEWWRLIPAWTMLALAGMIWLSTLAAPPMSLIAALLFWGMALGFTNIYLLQRAQHWWAIIPGGFMLVLGIVIALSSRITDLELLGGLLFAGMGGVFYLLYSLSGQPRQWWALIPGSVLFLFGIFIAVAQQTNNVSALRWWPLLIVIAGGIVWWRTGRPTAPVTQPAVRAMPGVAMAKGVMTNVREKTATILNQASAFWNTQEQQSSPMPSTKLPLGDYREPAPGASVDILPHPDEQPQPPNPVHERLETEN